MKLNEAKKFLLRTSAVAYRHNERANAVELRSAPGVGKSETVEGERGYAYELALMMGMPVAVDTFMLATILSPDMRGFAVPQRDEASRLITEFALPPWAPERGAYKVWEPYDDGTCRLWGRREWHAAGRPAPELGVLFLDEYGQGEPDVIRTSSELLLNGTVGDTTLPPGWRVIAASNRMSDRAGVQRPMMHIVNRRCAFDVENDAAQWEAWANEQPPHRRPHYLTRSFVQQNSHIVFGDSVPAEAEPFCTPRSLTRLDRDLRALALADAEDQRAGAQGGAQGGAQAAVSLTAAGATGTIGAQGAATSAATGATGILSEQDIALLGLPLDEVARATMLGWIGKGAAGQFVAHIKFSDEVPSVTDIVRDPNNAKLPDRADIQIIAALMLAEHVNNKNAKAVFTYVNRLRFTMQVRFVLSANTRRGGADALSTTQLYSEWLAKNGQTLLASS